MLRLIGSFGLGVVFVIISPGLRRTIMECVDEAQASMIDYSPWSFVAAGIGLLVLACVWLRRANQPKL